MAQVIEFKTVDEQWEDGEWHPREHLFLTKVSIDGEDVDVHFMAHDGMDAMKVVRAMSEQYHQMERKIIKLETSD